MKTFYTTVQKKEYPYIIEILETLDSGMVKCKAYDIDGVSQFERRMSELRPYTLSEFWQDINRYYENYGIDSTVSQDVFLDEFAKYLDAKIAEFKAVVDEIEKDAAKDGIDLYDLPSNILWEHDRTDELVGVLMVLQESIEEAKTIDELDLSPEFDDFDVEIER